MGVYLVSVGAEDWFGEEEDGWGEVASALDAEIRRRGLPPYESVPAETAFAPGSGQAFEEKLTPDMTGFLTLCQTHLSREESELLSGWTVLVPFSLDEEIWLAIESDDHDSVVVGAPQVLPLAEKLAGADSDRATPKAQRFTLVGHSLSGSWTGSLPRPFGRRSCPSARPAWSRTAGHTASSAGRSTQLCTEPGTGSR